MKLEHTIPPAETPEQSGGLMFLPSRILALDLETTGLVANYDSIVQIAAVVMENGVVVGDPFSSRMSPDPDKLKIGMGAVQAQCGDIKTEEGRTKAAQWLSDLFDAPRGLEVAKAFSEWCETNQVASLPVVAHNASFDHAFVAEKLLCWKSAFKKPPLSPTWICTLTLAKHVWPGNGKYGLNECLIVAGLPARPPDHIALQDAILAGALYFRLAAEMVANSAKVVA